MGNQERAQIFDETFQSLSDEIGGACGGAVRKANSYYDWEAGSHQEGVEYTCVFTVEGPLYDLEAHAEMQSWGDSGDFRRVTLAVYAVNAVRTRKVRELRREVAIKDLAGSEAFRPDLETDEIKTDADFQTACEQVKQKFLDHCYPLQTIEEFVEEIRRVKEEHNGT